MAIDYGEIAVQVVKKYSEGDDVYALWEKEYNKYNEGKSKVCPRSVFLALCELGRINGIVKGKYSARILRESPKHANELIRMIKNNPEISLKELRSYKCGAQCMADVFMALYKENLLLI